MNNDLVSQSQIGAVARIGDMARLVAVARLVAIVRLERLDRVIELVHVLLDAGVRCVELTLTNPSAPTWVQRLLLEERRFQEGQAILGIGSVRTCDDAKLAIDSGAQFLVTPITSIPVIEHCVSRGMPIAAGALTPTEIAGAWDAGASWVKVFPARALGPAYIRDVLAPMPALRLIPTGGIDASNAKNYLDAGAVAVGVGGQLCRADWVDQGDWDSIRTAAEALVRSTRLVSET